MKDYIYQAFLTPEKDGGYSAEIRDLPGCLSQGDDFNETIEMIIDSAKTYVGALLKEGEKIPGATMRDVPEDVIAVYIAFETDASYIIEGECVSAAQAARELNVSRSRISHMIKQGLLDAYREGRNTYVSVESIEKRKANPPAAGRPKKEASEVA